MNQLALLYLDAPVSALAADVVEELLALADDELLIGHRHSEWLGRSPFLEEDLTMVSIAQDEIGHARALYALIWPDWESREVDVVRRPPQQWRSCAFVERETNVWEQSLMRHWLYDLFEPARWIEIGERFGDLVAGLPELIAKVLQEERFHRQHASGLVQRLAASGPVAQSKLQVALDDVGRELASLVSPSEWAIGIEAAVANGLQWLRASTVSTRETRHVDFTSAHIAMLDVVAFDPTAKW